MITSREIDLIQLIMKIAVYFTHLEMGMVCFRHLGRALQENRGDLMIAAGLIRR